MFVFTCIITKHLFAIANEHNVNYLIINVSRLRY